MGIHIFYHLFAVPGWESIWRMHRNDIVASGLYEACDAIHFGIVCGEAGTGDAARTAVDELPKARLLFNRQLSAPPVGWPLSTDCRPHPREVGEAETIWALLRHAEHALPKDIYLFLHTKGVTNPSWRTRKHLPYFRAQGCLSTDDHEVNAFVLDLLRCVVSDWRQHVADLETCAFSYRLFNFFWVRASLLQQFDVRRYLDWHAFGAPPAHRRHTMDGDASSVRHLFALFPIKLHACANGRTLKLPPYQYIDVIK